MLLNHFVVVVVVAEHPLVWVWILIGILLPLLLLLGAGFGTIVFLANKAMQDRLSKTLCVCVYVCQLSLLVVIGPCFMLVSL